MQSDKGEWTQLCKVTKENEDSNTVTKGEHTHTEVTSPAIYHFNRLFGVTCT